MYMHSHHCCLLSIAHAGKEHTQLAVGMEPSNRFSNFAACSKAAHTVSTPMSLAVTKNASPLTHSSLQIEHPLGARLLGTSNSQLRHSAATSSSRLVADTDA